MALSLGLAILLQICSVTAANFLVADIEPSLQKILDLQKDMSEVKTQLINIEGRLEGLENITGPPTTAATPEVTSCPDGWFSFEGSCYYFSRNSATFTVAQKICAGEDSHVVHVDTEAENTFLKGFMLSILKERDWWIGMNDYKAEGLFILTGTDTKAPFVDWDTTGWKGPTPLNDPEDCAFFDHTRRYQWNDYYCHREKNFLCEKKGKV